MIADCVVVVKNCTLWRRELLFRTRVVDNKIRIIIKLGSEELGGRRGRDG
jgi:hypothetical protein